MKNKESLICDTFTCVIGVNEGYFHQNDVDTNYPTFYSEVQRIADEIYTETGKYVGFVVAPAKVVYKEEWGCPSGGEDVYVLSGNAFFEANSEEEEEKWADVVELFILKLKTHFKQTTVQIEWSTKVVVRYT